MEELKQRNSFRIIDRISVVLKIHRAEFKRIHEMECCWKSSQTDGDTWLTRTFPLRDWWKEHGDIYLVKILTWNLLLEDVKYWMPMTPKCPKLTLLTTWKELIGQMFGSVIPPFWTLDSFLAEAKDVKWPTL